MQFCDFELRPFNLRILLSVTITNITENFCIKSKCFIFYASASNRQQSHYDFVRPFVVRPWTPILPDAISVLYGWISMKLVTNIHHVRENYWKDFQGQRSKFKAMTRRRRHTFRRCGIKACSFLLLLRCWQFHVTSPSWLLRFEKSNNIHTEFKLVGVYGHPFFSDIVLGWIKARTRVCVCVCLCVCVLVVNVSIYLFTNIIADWERQTDRQTERKIIINVVVTDLFIISSSSSSISSLSSSAERSRVFVYARQKRRWVESSDGE